MIKIKENHVTISEDSEKLMIKIKGLIALRIKAH